MCMHNASSSRLASDLRTANVFASLTLATVGTAGNALSIGLICSAALQRSAPTMALILSMCCANLVSTSLLLPVVAASNIHGAWILGEFYCRAYGYVVYVTLTAESLQLVTLVLAQYTTVVHRVTSLTLRRCVPLLVGGPWVLACLIYLVPLTGTLETFDYDPRRGYCTLVSASGSGGGKSGDFVALLSALFGALMTLVNVYCYTAILYVTYRSRRRAVLSSVLEAAARFKGRARDIQLLRMTAIIFANFGLTYLPFLILVAADPCLEQISPVLFTVVLYVSWSHAATNPVIYALLNTKINRLWRELICCRPPRPVPVMRREAQAKPAAHTAGQVESIADRRHQLYAGDKEDRQNSTASHSRQGRAEAGDMGAATFHQGPSLIVIVEAVMTNDFALTVAQGRNGEHLRAFDLTTPKTEADLKPKQHVVSYSEV